MNEEASFIILGYIEISLVIGESVFNSGIRELRCFSIVVRGLGQGVARSITE